MTEDERLELEELRAFKILVEMQEADMANENVLLIEGELTNGGEFTATGVKTKAGHVYLAEVLKDLCNWRDHIKTFSYHIATKPMSFHALEEQMVKTAMGDIKTEFYHRYSDLTGYLWTEEEIKIGGHDVLKEINETASSMRTKWDDRVYIALRVEKGK